MTNYKTVFPKQGSSNASRKIEGTMTCEIYKCWVIVKLWS